MTPSVSVPASTCNDADVIHRRRSDHDQCADYQGTLHVCHRVDAGSPANCRAPVVKLRDLEFLAAEGVYHPNGTQSFLRLREQRALLFLNGGGLAANPFGKEIDRADKQRHDGEREQESIANPAEHDGKSPDQGHARTDNVSEAFVVDRLNRLRVVGDAKTGISRAAGVVEFEGQALQMSVKLGPQSKQRLQSDFHETCNCWRSCSSLHSNWTTTIARHNAKTTSLGS